jgi:predicted HicB family RNase H-like nuclease
MTEKKTIASRISPQLHKAVKVLSAEKEKPVEKLIEEALIDLLKKHGKKPPKID